MSRESGKKRIVWFGVFLVVLILLAVVLTGIRYSSGTEGASRPKKGIDFSERFMV